MNDCSFTAVVAPNSSAPMSHAPLRTPLSMSMRKNALRSAPLSIAKLVLWRCRSVGDTKFRQPAPDRHTPVKEPAPTALPSPEMLLPLAADGDEMT